MEEVEVKFLNIDPKEIERKILALGGHKLFDRVFKRIVFDHPDLRLNAKGAYLRLRDEGDRIMLAYKERQGVTAHDGSSNDSSMLEEQTEVGDFDTMAKILRHIGLKDKFYEENRRIHFELGKAEVDIDYWPLLKPYMEIEAPSWAEVERTTRQLGLDPADKKIFTTFQVYKLAGINELDYDILTLEHQVKKSDHQPNSVV
jgi:adenylate cyclase, class 2